MIIDLTVKNYRCFSDQHPATIQIQPGLTALVGKNNAGKSLIRLLYEFRDVFRLFSAKSDHPECTQLEIIVPREANHFSCRVF